MGGGGRRLATSRAPPRLTFCSTTTTVEPTSAAHEGEAHHVICASTGRSWAEARPRTSARPTRRRRRSISRGRPLGRRRPVSRAALVSGKRPGGGGKGGGRGGKTTFGRNTRWISRQPSRPRARQRRARFGEPRELAGAPAQRGGLPGLVARAGAMRHAAQCTLEIVALPAALSIPELPRP